MERTSRRRPSPALIVSVIALVVAMGGTGYAAFSLPKNSVGSKQLKTGAVTPSKVAKSTIALFKGQRGANGKNGTNGATNVVVRTNIGTDVSCNPGEVATGGGVTPDNANVTSSYPTPLGTSGQVTPTGWHGTEANNGDPNQFNPTVYVICASP